MRCLQYEKSEILNFIKKDIFKRNEHLLFLIDNIIHSDTRLTYAVDGSWGTGKTVFAQELQELINEKDQLMDLIKQKNYYDIESVPDMHCFYFNAWENDMISNPCLSLLFTLIQQEMIFDEETKQKLKANTNVICNILLKTFTNGVLSTDDFKNSTSDSPFVEYYDVEKVREEFIHILNVMKQKYNVQKIVFVIDELDRCRPNYSIQLLETIKHFYLDDSITFVVCTDLKQLGHTIKNFMVMNLMLVGIFNDFSMQYIL